MVLEGPVFIFALVLEGLLEERRVWVVWTQSVTSDGSVLVAIGVGFVLVLVCLSNSGGRGARIQCQ